MKNNHTLKQLYYSPRTAIKAEILFAARVMHLRFLKRPSGKTPRGQNSSSKKIGAESAVLHFVFFEVIVNKMQQSAKSITIRIARNTLPEVFPLTAILAGSGKTMPFEKRRSRYKETAENKAETYRVYGEHLFSACDAVDARIFSKGDGETIIYTYDKGGQLKGVSGVKNTVKGTENYSYIDTIVYDEHGQRVYIKYGNGVETRYRYDDKRRWLKDIETKNKQTDEVFQKIRYSFDKVGNVLGYSNDASVYETSQNYTYDSLYQLIGVEGTSNQYKAIKSFGSTPVHVAKYKQDFAFDGIGNMTRKASTTNIPGARGNAYPKAELDYSLDYEYDSAYAHRLVHAGNRYYRYDANGNITAEKDGPFTEDGEFVFTYNYDPDTDVYGTDYGFGLDAPKETEESHPENLFAYRRNYTWNEKNQLTKSSDRSYTVHYRYGEDGQRALKYTEEGRSETLYFNNFYTIHIPVQDKNNPQGLRVHKHIFVGNSRLVTAMTHTDNNGDNAEQREKRYYYHSDHLGSAQFVTDWRGKQYEHIEYTPYGELWIEEVAAGLDKLPFRFTGKEMDEETGLYYYGARYLDPKYSRWLSGDPALGEYIPSAGADPSKLAGMGGVFNVVNLHLYHYAGNNPVKYTDPDGRISIRAAIQVVRGFIYNTKLSLLMQTTDLGGSVMNTYYSTSLYQQQYPTIRKNAERMSTLLTYASVIPGPIGEIATAFDWLNNWGMESENIVIFDSRLNFIAGATNEINHIDSILEGLPVLSVPQEYGEFLKGQKRKLQREIDENKQYDAKQIVEIIKTEDFCGVERGIKKGVIHLALNLQLIMKKRIKNTRR